jgi:diguanylate cyclase (GGDEF)-like protein
MDEIDRDKKNYAVVVFDLNGLKKVNDTLGHEEGDCYIKEFGQVLKKTFQDYGFVGRTGGDEFQVLIQLQNQFIHIKILSMHRLCGVRRS